MYVCVCVNESMVTILSIIKDMHRRSKEIGEVIFSVGPISLFKIIFQNPTSKAKVRKCRLIQMVCVWIKTNGFEFC